MGSMGVSRRKSAVGSGHCAPHQQQVVFRVDPVQFEVALGDAGVSVLASHAFALEQTAGRSAHASAAGVPVYFLDTVGGALAVRYRSLARETWRALQVRFTRARRSATIERLRAERSAIYEAVAQLAEDLQLPGSVAADDSTPDKACG